MARARLYRATTSFACEINGVERFIRGGEVLPSSDPVIKALPDYFEAETPVEEATAAPGEKRKR